MTFDSHWRHVPEGAGRWKNFSPAEIACHGTGKLLINEPALDKLQTLRDWLGKPLIVRAAYRTPEHNRAVGGAKRANLIEWRGHSYRTCRNVAKCLAAEDIRERLHYAKFSREVSFPPDR